MSRAPFPYKHDEWAAGHGDVLKHVIFCTLIEEQQKAHPQGILLVDCMAGDGVYDLNQHDQPKAYQKGILRVLERSVKQPEHVPAPVKSFIDKVYATTGCSSADDIDVYPGSPVLGQHCLRDRVDEHRLTDKYLDEVQWLSENSEFYQLDAFDPQESMEFILPYTDSEVKHPVILIDPSYENDTDYANVKTLVTTILDQHPFATIMVWMPYLQNHPMRFSFPTSMRELAKKYAKGGRYFGSINIAKDGYQGSCVLVCNPTKGMDDLLDEDLLHWLANTMNMGKDEFTVEQFMKKKKG